MSDPQNPDVLVPEDDPNPWARLNADAAVTSPGLVSVEAPVTLAPDAIADAPHGIPYEWAGRTWRLRPQFDLRVVVALKGGDFSRALGLLLGREQTAALLDLDSDEPFTDDVLKAMIEAVAKSNGTTIPESSASSIS